MDLIIDTGEGELHPDPKKNAERIKARSFLMDRGLSKAWELNQASEADLEQVEYPKKKWPGNRPCMPKEERLIRDIVVKLIRYGNISDKQCEFISKLLAQIEEREKRKALREAEEAKALPIPPELHKTRLTIEGTVASVKYTQSRKHWDGSHKILVVHDDGWKLWGRLPKGGFGDRDFERMCNQARYAGVRVRFNAELKISHDDPKFGFFSRPKNMEILD